MQSISGTLNKPTLTARKDPIMIFQKCLYPLSVLFIMTILVSACSPSFNPTSTGTVTNIQFQDAAHSYPPSTPLKCPAGQSSGGQGTFVEKSGSSFIYHGAPLKFYGYTFYPASIGGASAWHNSTFT